jgi:chlorobactene glucosyltransferase
LTAAATHQRILDALLMPVSVLLMSRIAWQAIWWRWRFGGPLWKGRTITQPPAPAGGGLSE